MSLSQHDQELIGLGFYAVLGKLEQMQSEIHQLKQRIKMDVTTINQKLDDEAVKIAANTDAAASANALLGTLSQLIRDNVGDSDALQAIADRIDANDTTIGSTSDGLVAAVLANTPVVTVVPFVQKLEGETYPESQSRLFIYNFGKDPSLQAPTPSNLPGADPSLTDEQNWDNLPVG